MSKRLLLAGLPSHLEKFKEYWWCQDFCQDSVPRALTDIIPDNVVVETIDPMVFQYDEATCADHVVSLWDESFRGTHMDFYDYVLLPDLSGPWWRAQSSPGNIDELVNLMLDAMDLVKPGGCGIFDKILRQKEMKNLIAEKGEYSFYGKEDFILEKYFTPSGRLVVVLWKPSVAPDELHNFEIRETAVEMIVSAIMRNVYE
jgi:hypothetical protein